MREWLCQRWALLRGLCWDCKRRPIGRVNGKKYENRLCPECDLMWRTT